MKILLIILICITGKSARANVCPFGTKIFYGNGMLNTKADAIESSNALQGINLSEIERQDNPLEYDLAYNKSDSVILNVLSAVVQKLNNDSRSKSSRDWIRPSAARSSWA